MAQIVETNTWLKAFLKVSGIHPTPHGFPKNLSRLPLHLLTVASIALHGSITAVLPLPLHPFTFPPIPLHGKYTAVSPLPLYALHPLTVATQQSHRSPFTIAPTPSYGCPFTPSRLPLHPLTVASPQSHRCPYIASFARSAASR